MLTKSYSDYQIRALVPEALITLDAQDCFIYVNQIAVDMLNRKPEELLGKHIWTEFPEAVTQPVYEAYKKTTQSKQHVYLEEYNSEHDRWFENHIYQSSEGVTICLRDITERKKAEDALNENETLYRSILNASPDDITITDLQGNILMISPSALLIWGYQKEEEILGRSLTEFVVPEDIGRIFENISLLFQGVNVNPGLYTGLRKDKSSFPVEVNADFIRNIDGEPVKLILSIRDITERKRGEQALIDSENKYRELVENSPDSIVIYQEAKVVFVNNETVRLMAAENKAQLIGKPVLDFVHPDYRTFVIERMKKAAVEGIILPMEEEKFISLAGAEIDVEVKALPIMHENKPAVQLIIRDITQRKKTELLKQEAVDRLLKISSRIPGVIYQYRLRPDGTSCFPYASENIRDIYLVNPEDVREDASKVLALIHPDDLNGVMGSILESAKKLSPWQYEYRVKLTDNTIHTLYGNAIPQLEDDGSVLWHGYISDITERKEAEKELAYEQYLMKELMDHIPDNIYFKDHESHFIRINKALTDYFELTDPMQATGKTDFDFFNNVHAVQAFNDEQEIIRTGQPLSIEEKEVKKDGSVKWTLSNKLPLRSREGIIIGTFGISKDITERKIQEETIRESEEKWRKLVTSLPDFVALHDLDAKYTFLNHYAEGFSEKEVLGKSLYDFISQESREEFSQYFEACIKTNETKQFNHKAYGNNGVIKTYENVLVPIVNKNKEVVNVMSIAKDVTDRLLAEEAIKTKAEQLERTGEIAKVGGWEYDLRTKKRFWSKETCRILELDPLAIPEFESNMNYGFYSPESVKIIQDAVDEGIKSGKTYDLELQIITAKGRLIWVREQGDFLKEEGRVVKLYGVIQDITERKQSELSLKMAHQSYFDIFNSASEAIYILDEKGIFIDVNKGAEEMYLLTREELIGQSPATVAAPGRNDLEHNQNIMRSVFEKDITAHFEFWAVRKNGEVFPKEVFVNKGKYFGKDVLIATARDMTESKKAEQALRESEQFLNETQRVSKIGSYKLDIKEGLWESSLVLRNMFGIKTNGKFGIEYWQSFIHPDCKEKMHAYLLNDVIGKKQRFDKEYKVVNQLSGKEYWVHGIGDLEFDNNGVPVKMMGTIQDITEKKKTEEAIHAKEKLFKTLIENSNDGVVILNAWGVFKYIAPSIKTVLGYDEEDLLNTSLLDITHPDDYDKSVEIYKEVLANPVLYTPEFIPRIKHKDGSWRSIAGAMNNLVNDPLVKGIIGNFRDVTQQVLAEQAIRESEIKYRSLIDHAGDAIAIYEPSGKIIDVNKTGLQMLGYTKEEVMVMKVTDFFLKEEMEMNPMTYNKLQQGESSLKQRHFISKDGSLVFTEVRSQLLPDGRLLSIIRDLSERMKIQEQLRISNDNYSSLVNTVEGIVWEADAKTTQFSFVSSQAEPILGYPPEQWITEKDFWANHIHGADREWAVNYCAKYTSEKKSHDFEYRMIAADGRIVWLRDIVTVIIENNEPVKLRGIMIDITEKKLMEKGLEDYKFALNQSSIVDVSDRNGTIQYTNENFCKISGYSLEELKGKDHKILKSGYHSREHYKNLWDTVTGGKVWRAEVKNKAKDGSFYWVDSTIIPFLDEKGKPFQFITIRSDITKRKEAETQILNALERYDILSKATSDTIWDWDVPNNVIVYNQGIVKNFGYKATKVKNVKEWWDTNIHPDDRKNVHEEFEKAFQKRKAVVQVEYRYRSAGGNYKYILDRAFIIYGTNKKPERMIGSMQDITNEKEIAIRIEKEVIDAQEREWNQIGMELHDNVNQILAASMLLMGLGKEKMERGQNAASIINESEKHVGEAIAEIRRLSHQLAPVSVDNLSLEQVFESLIETVNVNKQIKVKLQMKALKEFHIPHKLQINLYRILQEQLNNIMKYAKASEVTITFKKVNHSFVFKIADNGRGFDPEAHTNGIGLENIKRRAKVFAGEFKLKTAPGKGCEILVEIPGEAFSCAETVNGS